MPLGDDVVGVDLAEPRLPRLLSKSYGRALKWTSRARTTVFRRLT
jgi:hypothetical protein